MPLSNDELLARCGAVIRDLDIENERLQKQLADNSRDRVIHERVAKAVGPVSGDADRPDQRPEGRCRDWQPRPRLADGTRPRQRRRRADAHRQADAGRAHRCARQERREADTGTDPRPDHCRAGSAA